MRRVQLRALLSLRFRRETRLCCPDKIMSSEDPPQTLSGRIRAFISSTPSPSDTDKTGVVADKRNPLGAAQSPVAAHSIAMHHSDIQQAPSVVAADQAKTEGPSAHNTMQHGDDGSPIVPANPRGNSGLSSISGSSPLLASVFGDVPDQPRHELSGISFEDLVSAFIGNLSSDNLPQEFYLHFAADAGVSPRRTLHSILDDVWAGSHPGTTIPDAVVKRIRADMSKALKTNGRLYDVKDDLTLALSVGSAGNGQLSATAGSGNGQLSATAGNGNGVDKPSPNAGIHSPP